MESLAAAAVPLKAKLGVCHQLCFSPFNMKTHSCLLSISSSPLHCQSSRSRFFTASSKLSAARKRDKKISCEFDGKVNGFSSDSGDSRFLDRVATYNNNNNSSNSLCYTSGWMNKHSSLSNINKHTNLLQQRALDAAMNDINSSFGKGSVTRLGSAGGALVYVFLSPGISV